MIVGKGKSACAFVAGILALCVPPAGMAAPAHDFSTYRPSAEATRVSDSEAPTIDGDISDAIWARSKVITEFYQVEPKGGEPATEKTEVRVLYDQNAIYFSFHCHDSDPANIPLGAKARDNGVVNGDFVRIYLDPNVTRRDGYAFEVNVLGGRQDGLLSNNSEPIYQWNTIWAAKTKRVADGWTVEVEIPFRSISFDANRKDWGFDLYRRMWRISERVRWTSADPTYQTFDLTHSGLLTGIEGITQGVGLDIQTFAAVRYKHEWEPEIREDDTNLALSGNIFYKVTPNLTTTLTVNPDFSDTPLDQRRINTSRFALFFPETRDFFLQDASAFEFGGRPFQVDPNGAAFFSRNIGLVNGVAVPIEVGGKLSGTIGNWNVGGFTAMAGGLGGDDDQILSVARVSHPIFEQSKFGFVFTNGDPTGETDNTVAGADFQYRTSSFMDDRQLQIDATYLRSMSSLAGDDNEYTLSLSFPNEPWSWSLDLREIGENFTPALGFVNRTGIRDGIFNIQYFKRIEDPFLQWFAIGTQHRATTDLSNNLESYGGVLYVGAQNRSGDQMFINFVRNQEVVPSAFGVGGDAVVSAGTHRWNSIDMNMNTSLKRQWSLSASVSCCDFYDGQAVQANLFVSYRPDETWEISPGFSAAFIDMPSGSVSIYVPDLRINVNFSPDMTIQSQFQFDNLSQSLNASVRYRWEYSPGSELFFALGESALLSEKFLNPHYTSQTSQASVRIGHTFRY